MLTNLYQWVCPESWNQNELIVCVNPKASLRCRPGYNTVNPPCWHCACTVRVFKEMQTHLVSCCCAWLCGVAYAPACTSAPQSKHGLRWLQEQRCCLGVEMWLHTNMAELLFYCFGEYFISNLSKSTLTPLTWVFTQFKMQLIINQSNVLACLCPTFSPLRCNLESADKTSW